MPDWKSIVVEHGPMAYETAWRILGHVADTEDVVQDALLAAFQIHQKSPVQNWGGLLRHLSAQRAIIPTQVHFATKKIRLDLASKTVPGASTLR